MFGVFWNEFVQTQSIKAFGITHCVIFFVLLFKDHPEKDNQQTDQEHKDGNPVDRIHITDPAIRRLIRIFFPDIQVFGQFT